MCGNCKVTYYGKTFRHFYTRASKLMGISNLTAKRLKNVMQPTISDHLLQCNCTINFDDFDILSLLIKRDKAILNRTIKSFPLELFDYDDSFISIILLSHDYQGVFDI